MTITHHGHSYEIVDSIPYGYEIWNIGNNAPEGYVPLCRPIHPGSYHIDPDTLKAIKCDNAQIIMDAVGYCEMNDMERYVKRYENARPGTYAYRAACKIKRALPYIKQLTKEA